MAWLTNISTLTQSLQAAAEQATDVVRAVGFDGHLVSTRRWLQFCYVMRLLAVDGPAVHAAVACIYSYHDKMRWTHAGTSKTSVYGPAQQFGDKCADH
jgi:hypothetical protein